MQLKAGVATILLNTLILVYIIANVSQSYHQLVSNTPIPISLLVC